MNHKTSVFTALDFLPIYINSKMSRLMQTGMKRSKGNDRTARRSLVEPESYLFGRGGHQVIRDILAKRINSLRPVIRQYQAFGIRMIFKMKPEKVNIFTL